MKLIKTKVNVLVLFFLLIMNTISHAQKTYLKITKTDKENDYVMYPPGTKFELKNKQGYIVFKNSENPGLLDIKEEHILYVYPDWKDETDVFRLTEGKVEKLLTSDFGKYNRKKKTLFIDKTRVTAHRKITDSETKKGYKNLDFELSNGIVFSYKDGKYKAYLNEEENYLNIKGKYIIESSLGILKLSFNPSNGELWWVFEPKQ